MFAFILCCNWLAALPTEHWIPPPTADVNLVYPLALLVIVWVNVAGIRAKGAKAYFGHFTQPYAFLAPIEFITQYLSRPASLALRLFGNIFAGGIMVAVIALMPAYILWLPNAVWKLFDMFIGAHPGADLHPAHPDLLQRGGGQRGRGRPPLDPPPPPDPRRAPRTKETRREMSVLAQAAEGTHRKRHARTWP